MGWPATEEDYGRLNEILDGYGLLIEDGRIVAIAAARAVERSCQVARSGIIARTTAGLSGVSRTWGANSDRA